MVETVTVKRVFQMKDSQAQDSRISPLLTSLFNTIVLDAPYTEQYVNYSILLN